MKILKFIPMLLLIAGIAWTGFCAYGYFYNNDRSRALGYAAEQQSLLVEALRAKGTPRERELMNEYEGMNGLTELAWQNARNTRQTIMLAGGGGIALITVSLIIISRKRRSSTKRMSS
jgi:hypothetical protein